MRSLPRGHEVVALPSPVFVRGEDCVEIAYLFDGKRATFSSDLLLSLIVIKSDDADQVRGVWNTIGSKVGWVSKLVFQGRLYVWFGSVPIHRKDRRFSPWQRIAEISQTRPLQMHCCAKATMASSP